MPQLEVAVRESPQEAAERELRARLYAVLGELGGATMKDEDVIFEGDKLVVPEKMSLSQAVGFLENKIEEEEEVTTFSRTFRYRPWDGAWCAWQALREVFGAVGHRSSTVQTFFGKRKAPPVMLTINTGVDMQEQVPWGDFTVPYLPGLELSLSERNSPEFGPLFHIDAIGPKKYRHQVEGLFKVIEKQLKEHSMYRGKAFDGQTQPEFIDLTSVDPSKVVYAEEVIRQMEANVWSQLRHMVATEKLGMPLKRAILVHGPYGTGKSLFGMLTAQEAVGHSWTFIMARPGRDDLSFVMQTARLYQPAVVFFEDMDKVASPETETDEMTALLDTFDGIKTKGTKLMVVLTTNHPEKIHKAMVRPGRLDAIVEIGHLDQEGVENLLMSTIPHDILGEKLDFERIYGAMTLDINGTEEVFLPSFVKESGDRAMRYGLTRCNGNLKDVKLITDDFVAAAQGLHPQLELMAGAKDSHVPEPVGAAVGRVVHEITDDIVATRLEQVGYSFPDRNGTQEEE